VVVAQNLGAIGVIMFSDPANRAAEGRNFTYPNSWWMPGMAVESGSLYIADGDPLTPLYPSIGTAAVDELNIHLKHTEAKCKELSSI
jgi:N-acetylated-alpha-linked acidic dipeptidase